MTNTTTATQKIAADLVRQHGRKAHTYARVTGESPELVAEVLRQLQARRNQVAS
jgi:hypothetical protein